MSWKNIATAPKTKRILVVADGEVYAAQWDDPCNEWRIDHNRFLYREPTLWCGAPLTPDELTATE